MAINFTNFTIVALLLLGFSCVPGILSGHYDNNPSSKHNLGKMRSMLNRLDQLELKARQVDQLEYAVPNQKVKMDQLEVKLNDHQFKMDQLEVKLNDQQFEIDQLKKKNVELENKLESISSTSKATIVASASVSGRHPLHRSCYELKATNPSAQSGLYLIDPDGQINGDAPFQAYCDMNTGTTSIIHNTEEKTSVTSCKNPGCYTKQINYNASSRQMLMLADISESCQQYFKFDSLSVPFEVNGVQYGFWDDRNGAKQIFWAGPANSKHTCQCGLENPNGCLETQYNCNADSLAPIELIDEGYITATELLPVTRLSFGRTSLTGVKASYTLGRFECTGQALVSSKPENCRTLFQMGHTISGFYLVKSGSTKVATTYCDFSKGSTEVGYETRIGNVDVISSAVQFYVQRNTAWSTLNTPIVFQVTRLNVGNAMNIGTGVFKAPTAGTYSFSFSGLRPETTSPGTQSFIRFRLNGNTIGSNSLGRKTYSSSIDAILKLKVGDEITVILTGGTLYDSSDYYTHFTGILLEEDLVI